MPVTIQLPSVLAPLAGGQREVAADGATVREVVARLGERFPHLMPRLVDGSGAVYPFVALYLNDEDIRFLGGLDAAVVDGDEVAVVPAVAGG